jgi:alpha-L-fucosidase 2
MSMAPSTFLPVERAARHPIVVDRPAPDFFAGALLGNGGLGAVVTTRPDAVVIHLGHNNVWDIRVAERNRDQIGTFREIFDRVKAIPDTVASLNEDEWYRRYCAMCVENYGAPYPRPFPCGSLLLGFDRRDAELLGHRVEITTGTCDVRFLVSGDTPEEHTLRIIADMTADRLWLRMLDAAGRAVASPFTRVRLIPDPDTPDDLPPYTAVSGPHTLSFRQLLPAQEPDAYDAAVGHAGDRAFRLTLRTRDRLQVPARRPSRAQPAAGRDVLEQALAPGDVFTACVQLDEGPATAVGLGAGDVPEAKDDAFEAAASASRQLWRQYWNKSGVALDDEFLERVWYHNLYFLNCAVKAEATCPGLFANWSYRDIGTAWHGDYHLNYNVQQPFWGTFASNHVEKHLAYVGMVEHLLPVSQGWAREYYGLRGACFPHSAYPTSMTMMPYPLPTWGWEICETPWAVQSVWWHYLYTMDKGFLEHKALPLLRQAVLFLVDYMRRPEAHGAGWDDDAYHIFPTVPPELYGLTPGLAMNHDCLVDLTLARFVFNAYRQACAILAPGAEDNALVQDVEEVLAHLPPYPTAVSPRGGTVFVSVPGEDPEVVYNAPNSTMTVFPGEHHGMRSPAEDYEIAANSYRHQRNEGGNELVFLNLQGARLGLLDLEKFKRQIRYCLLPNGTCTDMVLQVHGRYHDTQPYNFMARMGIWCENFALPAVIAECLVQGYDGILRFFPNWPADRGAEFRTLRAAGAFLVSAACVDGHVQWIEVRSEAGTTLQVINPWHERVYCTRAGGVQILEGALLEMATAPGEVITLRPAQTSDEV